MSPAIRLSVVIPCYKSGEALDRLVDRLVELYAGPYDVEVVLVHDHSPDQGATWRRLQAIQSRHPSRVSVLDLARNFGEHPAIMAGLQQATGNVVVTMDDDGQNPPEEVGKLVEAHRSGEVDVVYGVYEVKQHHWFRNLGSRFNGWAAGALMGKPEGLYLSSFKAMNRFLVDRVLTYRGSYPYIDGMIFQNTDRYSTVQVSHVSRAAGESGYTLRKLLRLYSNMALGFSILPLRAAALMGVIAATAGVLLGLWFMAEYLYSGQPVQGWTSTALLIVVFSGITLLALGVFGEYLGRFYLASFVRPQYVAREVRLRSEVAPVHARVSERIPFQDFKAHYQAVRHAVEPAVHRVLESGWYLLGPELDAFEEELAAWLGGGQVVGLNSGTDALVLAMIDAGVKPGDEVITVGNSAIPSAAAIHAIGAVPVYADLDPGTWLMDPGDAARRITPKTRAICPVHLYGEVFDPEPFHGLARERGLALIEDAAQAMGGMAGGRRAGTLGDYGAFSMYPTKTLGAFGDAGALWVPERGIADRLRALRFYGQETRGIATVPRGCNSRMDEVQAAILRAKLPLLDAANARRRELGLRLARALDGALALPAPAGNRSAPGRGPGRHDHVYHLFVGLLPEGVDREVFRRRMKELGVDTLVHYSPPLYRHPAFEPSDAGTLPVTEKVCSRIVSLPLYPELPDSAVDRIAEAVREAIGSARPAHAP